MTFKVTKHYKNSDNPNFLKFQLNSEGEITGKFTSCDWDVEKGEHWLVYAKKISGELNFQFYCSNSMPLGRLKIYPSEQKILDYGNKLDLAKYRYMSYDSRPVTNVDSILEKYQKKKLEPSKGFASVLLDINSVGNLTRANLHPNRKLEYEVIDTIFGMNQFKNTYREPNSDLEKLALKIAREIKHWEQYYYLDLEKPVKYRKWLKVYVDKDSIIQVEF